MTAKKAKKTPQSTTLTLVAPIPIVEKTPTIDLHRVLDAIAHTTSINDIYSFLIANLRSKIKENEMNTTYWKNQVVFMKQHKEEKVAFKSYQLMITANKKDRDQLKKALTSLQKAQKHLTKGTPQ